MFKREILESLLAAGADINALDGNRNTPLHIAALAGHTTLVDFFVKNNSSLDATNDDGLTARDLAQSMLDEHEDAMEDMTDEEEIEEYIETTSFTMWYDVMDVIDEEKQRREDLRMAKIRQTTCLAVMMGHHHRIGGESWFNMIDSDVTRLVLQFVWIQ